MADVEEIAAPAVGLRARTVWVTTGLTADGTRHAEGYWMTDADSAEGRGIVEPAGLAYLDRPSIAEALRRLGRRP